ncbi:MAG TPA: tetratricopeptide repeat protein [Candidatus Polarisedimenticolaceae bacterium]|nr:tetratricopeptide repeat protein [Candidatus Polarisedimenticolaceae bacterium]
MRHILAALLLVGVTDSVLAALGTEANSRTIQQASALCRKGAKALQQGDKARASESFEKALAVFPDFPDAHLGLGHLAMAEARFDDALQNYQRARQGYLSFGGILQGLREENYRETQRRMGQVRDQISSLGRSTTNARTDPRTEAEITRNLTLLQDELRRLEAIEPPKENAGSDPPAEVWFYIGNAQFKLEKYDEARAAWETSAQLNPSFAMIHNNLAVIYWKAGRFNDAQTELATAERLGFPVNPKMKEDLARASGAAVRH